MMRRKPHSLQYKKGKVTTILTNTGFECDSDVLALYGYILETYHICFVKIKALEELGISNYEIKEKGKEFKMYSCEMDNPIGKAFCVYMDKK